MGKDISPPYCAETADSAAFSGSYSFSSSTPLSSVPFQPSLALLSPPHWPHLRWFDALCPVWRHKLSVFLNKQTNVRRDMMQYSVTYCLFIISSPYPGLFTSWGPPGGTFEPVCVLFTSWTSQAELPKNTRSLVLPCLHYGRLLVPQGAGFPYATDSWWQAVFSN